MSLDVSVLLFPKIYSFDFIQSMNLLLQSIVIPNWTCNDIDYTVFDFSHFTLVETIEIGNDCFASVKTFKIDGLSRLKSLKIGKNSFTQEKNSYSKDESKSFHVLNCESLESIEIDVFSFSDYAGDFELKNLPQLQSIQIGKTESKSYSFAYSSFVIRGIELILNIVMIRSSKSTIHYIGYFCIL